MGKLTVLFYLFVIVVLGLFAAFSFLMTTVNPTTFPTKSAVMTAATTHSKPPSKPGLMKLMDYEEGSRAGESSKESKDPSKYKGRRSIEQRRKKNQGIVIMKIVDSDGRPRIEIVFYPKLLSNDWEINKKNGNIGSKRRKTNFLTNSILNVMPNDTIVFESKDISYKRNLQADYTVPDIYDNNEATTIVDVKSLSLLRSTNNNEMVTTPNTDLLSVAKDTAIENPYANIATEMKIDNDKERQTVSYNDGSLENIDNLPHFIIQYSSEHCNEIGFSPDSINTSIHNETATESNSVLLSQLDLEQDGTSENQQQEDTAEMTTELSEIVKKISYETESIENRELDSTSSDLNQDDSGHWNETKSVLESDLIYTSNHNEITEKSTVLSSQLYIEQEETEMKTDVSEDITISYLDVSAENTDNFLYSKSPDLIQVDSGNWNATETDLVSEKITTSNHEEMSEEHTVIISQPYTLQDASKRNHPDDTTKTYIQTELLEELKPIIEGDVSTEKTNNLRYSTSPDIITHQTTPDIGMKLTDLGSDIITISNLKKIEDSKENILLSPNTERDILESHQSDDTTVTEITTDVNEEIK